MGTGAFFAPKGGDIIIPSVDFMATRTGDGLEVYGMWRPQAFTFLKLNPEIWLYRYKRAKQDPNTNFRHKRFVHPSHLNGVKYPGSNLYSGDTRVPMTTEWSLPQQPFEKVLLDANWLDYFGGNGGGDRPYDGHNLSGSGRSEKIVFRFGIVIDNPHAETQEKYKKLHGPLSESELVIYKTGSELRWFINQQPISKR